MDDIIEDCLDCVTKQYMERVTKIDEEQEQWVRNEQELFLQRREEEINKFFISIFDKEQSVAQFLQHIGETEQEHEKKINEKELAYNEKREHLEAIYLRTKQELEELLVPSNWMGMFPDSESDE